MSDNLISDSCQTIKKLKEASDSLQDVLGKISTINSIFIFQYLHWQQFLQLCCPGKTSYGLGVPNAFKRTGISGRRQKTI